jgi:RHS repeat-associated protein
MCNGGWLRNFNFGRRDSEFREAGESWGRSSLPRLTACLLAVLAGCGLVLVPIASVPAGATPLGTVLILSSSVTAGSSSAEAAAATADGYSVQVDTGTTWDGLTESDFASYSAIILGDPTCGTSASSSIGAAVSDSSTWSPAITGNVVVAGNAPVASASGANPSGATTFTDDSIAYALAAGSGKTGLYVSLSCYYETATSGTSVSVLSGLGSFSVNGGIDCDDSGSINALTESDLPSFSGMTNAQLLGWNCSVMETFASWPSGYDVLALDHWVTTSNTTGLLDGLTGQPYVLVHTVSDGGPTNGFSGAVGGDIPLATTYGEGNAASPGITSGLAVAGTGVNPATGDFVDTATDAEAATFGPSLSVDRTYDAQLAQVQATNGTPSEFGHGWSSNLTASLSFNTTSNDIYTAETGLNGPSGVAVDGSGNVYIADNSNETVDEIAAYTHSQWGIAMTAGDKYTIAGTGTAGSTGDGGAATSALLNTPAGVAVDSSGNLFIADAANERIQEVAAASGTQWGVSMTAGDIYTVAGTTGSSGCTTSNRLATATLMEHPRGVAVDAAGDVYIADSGGNRISEMSKASHTQWGISMTAAHEYNVAGNNNCNSGDSGNGGVATSARLDGPNGIGLDASGDLLIADTLNERIQEVPAASGTQWGQSMTANDMYTIAGSAIASSGSSGDGGAATSGLLSAPVSATVDSTGDLFISDSANNRIQEVSRTAQTQWGISMGANDVYTIAGSATGTSGSSGDGGLSTSALLNTTESVAFDSAGDMLVLDKGNNKLREVTASTASTWPLTPAPSVTVNQGDGAQVTFVPPVGGSCTSPDIGPGSTGTYCAPPYVSATLTYNSTANLFGFITHPYESYTFGDTGELTSTTLPGGATSTEAYRTPSPGSGSCPSAASSCDTVTSASGRALVLGLNAQGLVTSVTDPRGNKWSYTYTGGNLISDTDPMGRVTSYSYDSSNSNPQLRDDLLTVTSPNGQSGGSHAGADLVNTYNSSGRVTSQTDPGNWVTSFDYSAMSFSSGDGYSIVSDPDGNKTTYGYGTGVLIYKVVGYASASPSETLYTPSTTTLLVDHAVDPDDGYTYYAYDTDGNVLSTTNQLGELSTKSYNSFDEIVCSTTPMAATPCSSLSAPTAVAPGGAVSPPSAAPPPFTTYSLFDTTGNNLWQTTGVFQPGSSTASYSRTTYQLFRGNSVTLGGANDTCGTAPPSLSLPCATIDGLGNVTQLGYNSAGDVTSSSIPDGNGSELATTSDTYDANGNELSETAPEGNISGADAANYTTTTTYDADNESLIVTLAGGTGSTIPATVTATYYDPDGNVIATTDATGNPYSSSNLSGCNPNTTTSCAGTTYFTFTADDKQTLVTDPAGNQSLTCYDGNGSATQTVPAWGVADESLAPSSCPTSYTSGITGSQLAPDATVTTYNALGKPGASISPPATGETGTVSTFDVYDPAGNPMEVISPGATGAANEITVDTYNLAGQMTTKTSGFGTGAASTTSNCYDPDGDQTASVPGSGNAAGVVACETTTPWTTSSPYQTSSGFDSVGELVSTVSPPPAGESSPATTTTTYDPVGNKLSTTDPSGNETTYTYNPLNSVVSTITSGQTSTDYYDADENEIATTAPGGNPYSSSNPTGCNPLTTSTCTYTTYNTYNSSNLLLTSTNPDGEVTTNYYDTSGNKIATTGPSGDPATCNPTASSTPCTDTTTYAYNSLNQLICEGQDNSANDTCTSPGGGAGITTYTYTADGKRATMVDGTGTTSYYYDSSDRVTSVVNGTGATVTYGYGQNSDETCISYPNSANNTCTTSGTGLSGVVSYGYNSANQLTSLSDWAGDSLGYTYNANGSVANLSANSSAVDVATGYDAAGNVSSIATTASGGVSNLLSLTYTRQLNGDITSEVPEVGSTTMSTKNYAYNGLNQVSSGPITGTTGSPNYGYSAGGQITQSTNSFASAGYDPSGELCWTSPTTSSAGCGSPPTGATTYSSNSSGQRTEMIASSDTKSYGWDNAMNQLTCVNMSGSTCSTSSPTSGTSVYTYDSDGLRATATVGSGPTTNFTWDPTTQIPRLLSDGTWDYLYLPGQNVPIEQISASGSSPTADLLLADANSNVRGMVQLTSGTHQDQLVDYTDYDAYGNPIGESGGSAEIGGLTVAQTSINANYVGSTSFGFGGGYTDATGLIYLVNRYYDPITAQFMSIDPLYQQTQLAYEYAEDNPINEADPSGEATALACGIQYSPYFYYEGTQLTESTVETQACLYAGFFNIELQFNVINFGPLFVGYMFGQLKWSRSRTHTPWSRAANLGTTGATRSVGQNEQVTSNGWYKGWYEGLIWEYNTSTWFETGPVLAQEWVYYHMK